MSRRLFLATGDAIVTDPPVEPPDMVRRQITDRCGLCNLPFSTSADRRTGTSRQYLEAERAGTSITLTDSNLGTTAADSANSFTIARTIEKADGSLHPISYSGSARKVLAPREHAVGTTSVELTEGEAFWIRTYLEVATSGMQWPGQTQYLSKATRGEGTNYYGTGADLTTVGSGAWPGGLNLDGFGLPIPHFIIGDSPTTGRSLGIVGDSIADAGLDQYWNPGSQSGGGFVRSAKAAGWAYTNLAQSGRKMSDLNNTARREDIFPTGALESVDVVLVEMARNDLSTGSTLATLQGHAIAAWIYIGSRGPRVAQTTTTPHTNSTDGWASIENQTVVSAPAEAVRVAWNNWLRDGAPIITGGAAATGTTNPAALRVGDVGHPLVHVYEVADTVETARDSGKWISGYTADGLHPNATAYVPMAAAVNLAEVA